MSKYYLTRREAYQKLGLTGGDNFFITKDELLTLGADIEPLEKYSRYEFVVDDDIISSKNPRPPIKLPYILFEIKVANFQNSFGKYTDPVSGFIFNAGREPLVNYNLNNGIPELVIHTLSTRNVWKLPWVNFGGRYDEVFVNGNFTIVFIERGMVTTSSSYRQSVLEFDVMCQSIGWRDTNRSYSNSALGPLKNDRTGIKGTYINIAQLPLVGGLPDAQTPSMCFISVNRQTGKVITSGLLDANGKTIYTYGFGVQKYSEFTSNSKSWGWGTNPSNTSNAVRNGLYIGKALESDYLMRPGNAIGGVALYDYALSEGELKWLWENKVVTKPY